MLSDWTTDFNFVPFLAFMAISAYFAGKHAQVLWLRFMLLAFAVAGYAFALAARASKDWSTLEPGWLAMLAILWGLVLVVCLILGRTEAPAKIPDRSAA